MIPTCMPVTPLPLASAAAAGRALQPAVNSWLGRVLMLALLCLTLTCIAGGASQGAASPPSVERSVKSAFLYKFLGYVEFPDTPEAAAPLTVGVVGADDISAELLRITAGRSVNNRPVAVRTQKEGDSLAGLQMLFIGAEVARPAALLRAAQQASVLSVTEADNGLQQGSVINFRVVEDRVRFEVSLAAAEKGNLKLSSRLLSVAYAVQKGGQ